MTLVGLLMILAGNKLAIMFLMQPYSAWKEYLLSLLTYDEYKLITENGMGGQMKFP
jgi:hypothetical protein